eukprot:SAG11_NODE_1183_length_5593_cov_7.174190_3_plen_66_part_00
MVRGLTFGSKCHHEHTDIALLCLTCRLQKGQGSLSHSGCRSHTVTEMRYLASGVSIADRHCHRKA